MACNFRNIRRSESIVSIPGGKSFIIPYILFSPGEEPAASSIRTITVGLAQHPELALHSIRGVLQTKGFLYVKSIFRKCAIGMGDSEETDQRWIGNLRQCVCSNIPLPLRATCLEI